MSRVVRLVAVVSIVVLPFPQAEASTIELKVRDNYMTPDFRVLVTGDAARWLVEGANGHTVSSYEDAPEYFDSSPGTGSSCSVGGVIPRETDCLDQGSQFVHIFDIPGTYDYYCKVHGDPSIRPDPSLAATAQPCGMCGQLVVKTPSSAPPASRRPTSRASATPSLSASPEPSPSEVDPSADASTGPSSDPVASPGSDQGSPIGLVFAVVAIGVLSLLGYAVWRRFLSPS